MYRLVRSRGACIFIYVLTWVFLSDFATISSIPTLVQAGQVYPVLKPSFTTLLS